MKPTSRVAPKALEVRKLESLRQMAHRDAQDPIVVNLAARLARPHKPDDWPAIATEIHRFVRDGIRMQRDPDLHEEFAPSAVVIQRGWDDCDGKAKLAVALLRALGIEADIHPMWSEDGALAHVQYAARWPGSARWPGNENGWVRGETTISTAELGQNPYVLKRNPETGRLPFAGGHGST